MEREEILNELEEAFAILATQYLNETNNYDRLRELQDNFYKYFKLITEELEGFKDLEEFCSSYM